MDIPILVVFLDGAGIGRADETINPFFSDKFDFFQKFFGEIPNLEKQYLAQNGVYAFPVDARLGISGIPQSGTGQTSLFSGFNAAEFLGMHFGPFPYSTLLPEIRRRNIFNDFLNKGRKVCFANAFPKVFFDYVNSGKQRLSYTTKTALGAGMKLMEFPDLAEGRALAADITNYRWLNKLNYDIPVICPDKAASVLLTIAEENDFTLYEFFLTDHLGHGRIKEEFDIICRNLNEFLRSLIAQNYRGINIIIISDHGNFEDISVKGHTLNPSLCITAGTSAKHFSEKIKVLYDLRNSIVEFYGL